MKFKKNMVKVKDLIEYLGKFNPDAPLQGNVSGSPFDFDLGKHVAWCSGDGDQVDGDSRKGASEVFIDFTAPELAK